MSNSVCSSAAGAAAPAPPPAAGAPPTGAAEIVTLNLLLKASISSASSKTLMLPIASRISSLLKLVVGIVLFSYGPRQTWGLLIGLNCLGLVTRSASADADLRAHQR